MKCSTCESVVCESKTLKSHIDDLKNQLADLSFERDDALFRLERLRSLIAHLADCARCDPPSPKRCSSCGEKQ